MHVAERRSQLHAAVARTRPHGSRGRAVNGWGEGGPLWHVLTEPLAPDWVSGASVTDACARHVHVADKPEEIVPTSKPPRTVESVAVEPRVATIKQRPSSRCYSSVSDMNVSDREWQGSVCMELAILRVWGHRPHKRKVHLSGVSGPRCSLGLGHQLDPPTPTPGAAGSHVAGAHCPGPGHWGWGWSSASHHRSSGSQSVYERQGIAVMTPTVPGSPKGPFLGLPRGTMRRQKSIGKKRGHPSRGCPPTPRLSEPLPSPQARPQRAGVASPTPGGWGGGRG